MDKQVIIRNFGVLYRTFVSYMSKEISDSGISFSDSIFLMNIGRNEGIHQSEIAQALAIDKAAVARSIKNMVASNYVRLEISPVDKRAKKLFLTEEGKPLYDKLTKMQDKWLQHVLGDMPDVEVAEFAQTIEQISQRAKD